MPWFLYKLGAWEIAVDAINQQDAAQHIKRHAPGAEYQGPFTPPSMARPSSATAMTTARRQAQIESNNARWL